jgi:hypothetical protein
MATTPTIPLRDRFPRNVWPQQTSSLSRTVTLSVYNRYLAPAAAIAALALPAAQAADSPAAAQGAQHLEQRIDEMQQQQQAMQQQLRQLKSQNEALASAQQQAAVQPQSAAQAAAASPASSSGSGVSPNLSLWGYGEIYYTHPTHYPADTQFDLARAVFGIGYRFDDRSWRGGNFCALRTRPHLEHRRI